MIEDDTLRSLTTLGIKWKAPINNGGAEITDYLVSMAKSYEDFSAQPTTVTNTQFKAESLTAGVTYAFRI